MSDIDEAKRVLDEERKVRVQRCQERITQILEEEGCELDATVIVTSRGNLPRIGIVLKDS